MDGHGQVKKFVGRKCLSIYVGDGVKATYWWWRGTGGVQEARASQALDGSRGQFQ